MEPFSQEELAAAFARHRERLLALARSRLAPILLRRLSPEDLLSETYAAAAKRLDYFARRDDIPLYAKLRTLLFQTLADLERRHLQAGCRDLYREVPPGPDGASPLDALPADATSPVTRADLADRRALLRAALDALPENDRAILALRHFDGLGNSECAEALGLSEKAASLRHVRALAKLQTLLEKFSCFGKK